jgi:hypothetical protein
MKLKKNEGGDLTAKLPRGWTIYISGGQGPKWEDWQDFPQNFTFE